MYDVKRVNQWALNELLRQKPIFTIYDEETGSRWYLGQYQAFRLPKGQAYIIATERPIAALKQHLAERSETVLKATGIHKEVGAKKTKAVEYKTTAGESVWLREADTKMIDFKFVGLHASKIEPGAKAVIARIEKTGDAVAVFMTLKDN